MGRVLCTHSFKKLTINKVTNMNNSALFKKAHKQARKTVSIVGDYQIAFTLALRELVAEQKKPVKPLSSKISKVFSILGVVLLAVFTIATISGLSYLLGIVVSVMVKSEYIGLSFFLMFVLLVSYGMVTTASDEIRFIRTYK